MPAKKRPSKRPKVSRDEEPLERVLHALESQKALIEVIQSDNRTTREALQTSHNRLTDRLQELKEQSDARFDLLTTALRAVRVDLKGEIADVRADLKGDIARVEAKVDKLVPLEERVAALERRRA